MDGISINILSKQNDQNNYGDINQTRKDVIICSNYEDLNMSVLFRQHEELVKDMIFIRNQYLLDTIVQHLGNDCGCLVFSYAREHNFEKCIHVKQPLVYL